MAKKPTKKKSKKLDRKKHPKSTWNADKWRDIIDLVKTDVNLKDAIAYAGVAESTFYDWIKRDEVLSEEYERSKRYMDVISWQVIHEAIEKDRDVKTALEYKKRRDKRYSDKAEVDHNHTGELITYNLPKKDVSDKT